MENKIIFSARDIEIEFSLRGKRLKAIRKASLDLFEGETFAIVGESGSGKSVFTKSFIGMTDKNGSVTGGQLLFHGEDLTGYETEDQWLKVRGKKIAMIFQDPMTSLNPVRTIGEQISEVFSWHLNVPHGEAKAKSIDLLKRVGISDAELRYGQYPQQFSGGMRQRVVIAIAIACRPEILICDEPTTALDVTVQAQILELIQSLQEELKMTVVYITHDLGVVAKIADRVGVMYAGQIIEYGNSHDIFKNSFHPYTKALLRSLPQLGIKGRDLFSIKGTPPNLYKEIEGDAFAPRNPQAMLIDFKEEPPLYKLSDSHYVKSWLLHPMAQDYLKAVESEEAAGQDQGQDTASPEGRNGTGGEVLVSVKNLTVKFKLNNKEFRAVDDVSFDIYKGETLSLVGESGSGKTTIGRALMKIYQNVEGEILFKGDPITGKLDRKRLRNLRMEMQMIFQDPMASLNERAKVDYIISEGLYNHKLFEDEADRQRKVERIMEEVGLNKDFVSRFPHEFSGGQRQRIGIARSLVMDPDFVVADEPISALDVSIRAQVLNLLNKLKNERNLTYLFIAHDLSVVKLFSDRIAVIYEGKLVELAPCEMIFRHPLHPYTKALLSAVPYPDPDFEKNKELLVYNPAIHNYQKDKPVWEELASGHFVYGNQHELDIYRKELMSQ